MPKESQFVAVAQGVARQVLGRNLVVERGAALLYQVTVDNRLELTVDVRAPKRGQSAFQTDLCVFETRGDTSIPRVVLEFKTRITTHDILTYSAKARKHKQVYPYLRYGLVASAERAVPGRVFTHNEALDFCIALGGVPRSRIPGILERLLRAEVRTSRRLESIAFGEGRVAQFRTEVIVRRA